MNLTATVLAAVTVLGLAVCLVATAIENRRANRRHRQRWQRREMHGLLFDLWPRRGRRA
jgi:hypothetical protein